jgi:DNA-binding response OmpR family regulator
MTSDPRSVAPDTAELGLGALELFLAERRARLDGCDLGLSATEFALLWTLAVRHDQRVSVGVLIRAAGWQETTPALIYLDLYIRYLRIKLGDPPERPVALVAARRSAFILQARALAPSRVARSQATLLRGHIR